MSAFLQTDADGWSDDIPAKERGHWGNGCLVQDVIGDRVTTTPVSLDHGAALFGGRLISQERAA